MVDDSVAQRVSEEDSPAHQANFAASQAYHQSYSSTKSRKPEPPSKFCTRRPVQCVPLLSRIGSNPIRRCQYIDPLRHSASWPFCGGEQKEKARNLLQVATLKMGFRSSKTRLALGLVKPPTNIRRESRSQLLIVTLLLPLLLESVLFHRLEHSLTSSEAHHQGGSFS